MSRPARRVTRIAVPSAASLHLGSARLAVLTWLHARAAGGRVLLRVGDVAPPPGRHDAAGSAEQDLAWLGLDSDDAIRPAERLARYAEAAEALKRAGRLYPCLESEEELRAKRDWRIRRGKSPAYDRAMLKLTPAQRESAEAGGKRPHWRFRLSDITIAWNDSVLGRTETALSALSDPVAIQADGTPLPVLTSVVDDLDAGVTDIVRGADHIAQSAAQLDIHAALGGPVPRLAHVPQLRAAGDATRFEALTLRRLRGDGVEPVAMAAYLAELGSGRPAQPRPLADLAAEFDLAARAGPAVFDVGALQALNRRLLGSAPFSEVSGRLPPGVTETFWLAVRGSIDLLGEVRGWWDVVAGSIVPPVIEGEAAYLAAATAALPAEPWDETVWTTWTGALRAETGRKGKGLYHPLRLALTGEDKGPEMAVLLPLMGRARAAERLRLAAA